MSALAMAVGKSFDFKFTVKNWFSDQVFNIVIADADIGSLKSLHILFDKYFYHMLLKFEQNREVRTIPNFELFEKKMVDHIWKCVDAILKDVSGTETIVWC